MLKVIKLENYSSRPEHTYHSAYGVKKNRNHNQGLRCSEVAEQFFLDIARDFNKFSS